MGGSCHSARPAPPPLDHLSITNTRTHTHAQTPNHVHTQTHTRTEAHTHTHPHTHTRARARAHKLCPLIKIISSATCPTQTWVCHGTCGEMAEIQTLCWWGTLLRQAPPVACLAPTPTYFRACAGCESDSEAAQTRLKCNATHGGSCSCTTHHHCIVSASVRSFSMLWRVPLKFRHHGG